VARLVCFLFLCLAGAPAARAGSTPPRPWDEYLRQVRADGLVDRFLQATHALLGTPYANGPLGEGEGATPDPDPLVDFTRVDCVTFLEESLALALTTGPDGPFLANLDRIRYDRGHVDFAERNHYMVTDWIPANAWLVEDVTSSLAPGVARVVTRTIDRAAFLRGHGAAARPGLDDPRTRDLAYIPTESLAAVAPQVRSGDLVFWVGKADGIFVVHTGLAVRRADGTLDLRHGSSAAGHVLDEPFADYAARAKFAIGFLVLRLRDDAGDRPAAAREDREGDGR
jgi:N-acetylmuramoyl-L-alanine amidase-like